MNVLICMSRGLFGLNWCLELFRLHLLNLSLDWCLQLFSLMLKFFLRFVGGNQVSLRGGIYLMNFFCFLFVGQLLSGLFSWLLFLMRNLDLDWC